MGRGVLIAQVVEEQVAMVFNQELAILARQGRTTHSDAVTEEAAVVVAKMVLEGQVGMVDFLAEAAVQVAAMTAQEMEA